MTVDDYSGAYEAPQHLLRQGYRKFMHFAGPSNLEVSQQRSKGYQAELSDHGLDIDPGTIIECLSGTDEESLANASNKPDAIFANNDMAAVGAMRACKAAGLRISEDVGIVGFSNWQFCTMLDLTLSSVLQPGFDMGVKATEIPLDWIEKKIIPSQKDHSAILNTELIVRNSSVR